MSEETPGQDLEPIGDDGDAGGGGTAVAVAERPGELATVAHEQRVELRKDRMWLPFLIPVAAILTVALFTINLSRIFLAASADSKDPAVIAAIIATLSVLIGATVIAATPKLRTSTLVLTVCGVLALVLLGGSLTLGAAENKEVKSAEPTGAADNTLAGRRVELPLPGRQLRRARRRARDQVRERSRARTPSRSTSRSSRT